MGKARVSPGAQLRQNWARLSGLPGGKWLFSRLVGWMAPYSGSIGANIQTLEPGHVVITMRDRHAIRQHLNSVHAIALANLAELSSGLAMSALLPDNARGIVTNISIAYLKKARGLLTAESRCELPDVSVTGSHDFFASIRDEAGDEVARATVTWKLGPVPSPVSRTPSPAAP